MATSYIPKPLSDLRNYLKPLTGLDNISLGIVNNETDASYHHGWAQRDNDGTDYSWDESPRDWNWKTDAARALDIGMFPRLRELSVWLVDQCKRGAPDCADIREIIYSPDGKVVKRWDRLGIRTSGDDSHLYHTHISWFADAENRSKMGPFVRFFGGVNMMYLKVSGPEHPEVYHSDGNRSRLMPEGTWTWVERLTTQHGVPFLQDFPNKETLLKFGGPLDSELGGDSGGGTTPPPEPFPSSFQLEIPGFTVTATVVEGE